MSAQTTGMPFGITIERDSNGSVTLSSELIQQFTEDQERPAGPVAKASADAIESLLMAMAGEGFDMTDSRLWRALEASVEGIANNMDDEPASRVVISVDGGLVHQVMVDGLVEVMVVDHDIEGSDQYVEHTDAEGKAEEVIVFGVEAEVMPEEVECYFKTLNAE